MKHIFITAYVGATANLILIIHNPEIADGRTFLSVLLCFGTGMLAAIAAEQDWI